MNHQLLVLIIFIVAYIAFAVLPKWRTWVAVAAVFLLLILGLIAPISLITLVNWNVMGIFVGMLVVADVFMESRVPAVMAEVIVDKAKNTGWAILFICIMTSFISAFVENVATVLIVAPIALALAKKIKFNPVNMLIAIAISSNLQGAATLIGDPPSMLLGGFAKMTFMDFFFYHGKPSIFFAVEVGALASFIVLYLIFGKEKHKAELIAVEKVRSWAPTWILVILIIALAVSSFFDTGFSGAAGIICMVFAGIALFWKKFFDKTRVRPLLKGLDWDTTFFLMGVFILVGSVTESGWIERISSSLSGMIGDNILMGFIVLVVVSVICSAFVDNVPFLAAMLPVGLSMGEKLNMDPSLFLFGLLIGASIGGNITPIGASANIVACSLLKKEGHHVSFGRFASLGLPFTIVAVAAACTFVWFFWHG